MENVIKLSTGLPPPKVSADVVSALEIILEDARAGRVMAVAIVSIERDMNVATIYECEDGHWHYLVSGVARLFSRVTSR